MKIAHSCLVIHCNAMVWPPLDLHWYSEIEEYMNWNDIKSADNLMLIDPTNLDLVNLWLQSTMDSGVSLGDVFLSGLKQLNGRCGISYDEFRAILRTGATFRKPSWQRSRDRLNSFGMRLIKDESCYHGFVDLYKCILIQILLLQSSSVIVSKNQFQRTCSREDLDKYPAPFYYNADKSCKAMSKQRVYRCHLLEDFTTTMDQVQIVVFKEAVEKIRSLILANGYGYSALKDSLEHVSHLGKHEPGNSNTIFVKRCSKGIIIGDFKQQMVGDFMSRGSQTSNSFVNHNIWPFGYVSGQGSGTAWKMFGNAIILINLRITHILKCSNCFLEDATKMSNIYTAATGDSSSSDANWLYHHWG